MATITFTYTYEMSDADALALLADQTVDAAGNVTARFYGHSPLGEFVTRNRMPAIYDDAHAITVAFDSAADADADADADSATDGDAAFIAARDYADNAIAITHRFANRGETASLPEPANLHELRADIAMAERSVDTMSVFVQGHPDAAGNVAAATIAIEGNHWKSIYELTMPAGRNSPAAR